MEQFVTGFLTSLSTQFYISQVIAIVLLAAYGLLIMMLIRGKKLSLLDYMLAYPLSLMVYALTGYFILSVGIKYCAISQLVGMLAVALIVFLAFKDNLKSLKPNKAMCIYVIASVIIAIICTSGIIPVSVSNDSMYFFSEYPRALVNYGYLNHHLDNFLTDASQGVAIIGTIPFMFGFDEIFGLQECLSVNFVALFAYFTFDYAKEKLSKNETIIVTAISLLMLVSSMPFVLMSKWLMANTFFMEYMAIIVCMAYKYASDVNRANLVILSVFLTGLSIMRMEGALNAGVLVLCIMMLGYDSNAEKGYKNKDVAFFLVCPMLILQALYLFRIFVLITLQTGIQFMTKGKAVILIGFLIAVIIFALFIKDKMFTKLWKYYPWLLIAGLVLVNAAVFLYDRGDYITNMKAYILNVIGASGWGLFASFVIGVLILVPKKSIKINYFDFSVICYCLLTIVAGWARGDNLWVSFGDSGNRILIQVVPMMIFALIVKVIEGLEYWKKESSN